MDRFALFRAYIEEELLCEAENPVSDEDFFQRLYSMNQEEYGVFVALDILYNLPAKEECEEISDFLRRFL